MTISYPTDIHTVNGWERIHTGHSLDPDELIADFTREHIKVRSDQIIALEEVFFSFSPRVKWCGRRGNPCFADGTWHPHWYGVEPTPDPSFHFTLVRTEPR